jgi:hypothetical protein
VERRVRQELIPLLLKKAIDRHTGRGINYACDCEFCIAKREHTKIIGTAHYLMRRATSRPSSLHAYMIDPYAMENWIWMLRRGARRIAREELKQLKEK